MQDKEGLNNFWKKLLHKYRFVIITDDSFEEKLSVKLNRLNIFAFAGIFVFICFSYCFLGDISGILKSVRKFTSYIRGGTQSTNDIKL